MMYRSNSFPFAVHLRGLACVTVFCWTLLAADTGRCDTASDWTKPFEPDENTVVLYHFDEGQGAKARDACGDAELTLRAKVPLWGSHPGFGSAASFTRRKEKDDANVFVGPTNNDKIELRTCTEQWTIEAWLRFTGKFRLDAGGTYANICGTDDEGFSLPDGVRAGWNFYLSTPRRQERLAPNARYLGSSERTPEHDVNKIGPWRLGAGNTQPAGALCFTDQKWHHVAWQFRYADQTHFLFLDGKLIWKFKKPGGRRVLNDAERCDIPFQVGGLIHSQDPPFYLNYGNFDGQIDELRISNLMRYPVAEKLAIVRRDLADAGLKVPYSTQILTDAAQGDVAWKTVKGQLPPGLSLDPHTGAIQGTPTEVSEPTKVTLRATDAAGNTDEHTFTIAVQPGRIRVESLPLAFAGHQYRQQLQTEHMVQPVRWKIPEKALPKGISFDESTGELAGAAGELRKATLRVEARDAAGQTHHKELVLKVVPAELRKIGPDEHTVALWDWQGPGGKLIKDLMGDDKLTLTWVNMKGDTRLRRPEWGRYPHFIGGGEGGFVGPQHNDKVNLRTCKKEWTVEAWVRRGGRLSPYTKQMGGRHFDFGHICGTYDNSKRGVWELYLSDHDAPDGNMAPGVHFLGAEPDQALMDLHPWKRPQGIVGDPVDAGIRDTEWHHVAWQYSHAENLHQLLLDGKLIWQMQSPDDRKLVNNRKHEAQFSVGANLTGYARYGGSFNWLGWGNFFGQIGEIRISNVRQY